MKTLFTLRNGLSALIVSAAIALPAVQAEAASVKFTLGTTNSTKEFSVQAMQRWAEAMRKRSGGEIQMKMPRPCRTCGSSMRSASLA